MKSRCFYSSLSSLGIAILLMVGSFASLQADPEADFAHDYFHFYELNLSGDEELERENFSLALAYYQQGLSQLENIQVLHPEQDADLVVLIAERHRELSVKIEHLKNQGVQALDKEEFAQELLKRGLQRVEPVNEQLLDQALEKEMNQQLREHEAQKFAQNFHRGEAPEFLPAERERRLQILEWRIEQLSKHQEKMAKELEQLLSEHAIKPSAQNPASAD